MLQYRYTVKFTQRASEDLEEIYDYISNKLFAENAADNLLQKIEISIMRLEEFPYSCSYVKDEILREKGYRKLIIENYIVFYLVNEEEKDVIIMRILHGTQKYQDIL